MKFKLQCKAETLRDDLKYEYGAYIYIDYEIKKDTLDCNLRGKTKIKLSNPSHISLSLEFICETNDIIFIGSNIHSQDTNRNYKKIENQKSLSSKCNPKQRKTKEKLSETR